MSEQNKHELNFVPVIMFGYIDFEDGAGAYAEFTMGGKFPDNMQPNYIKSVKINKLLKRLIDHADGIESYIDNSEGSFDSSVPGELAAYRDCIERLQNAINDDDEPSDNGDGIIPF